MLSRQWKLSPLSFSRVNHTGMEEMDGGLRGLSSDISDLRLPAVRNADIHHHLSGMPFKR